MHTKIRAAEEWAAAVMEVVAMAKAVAMGEEPMVAPEATAVEVKVVMVVAAWCNKPTARRLMLGSNLQQERSSQRARSRPLTCCLFSREFGRREKQLRRAGGPN